MLPNDAEFSTGLDLTLLGTILLDVVGFGRGVANTETGGQTPRLFRFAEDSDSDIASLLFASEVGLLEPAADAALGPVALLSADLLWTGLTATALPVVVLGPL